MHVFVVAIIGNVIYWLKTQLIYLMYSPRLRRTVQRAWRPQCAVKPRLGVGWKAPTWNAKPQSSFTSLRGGSVYPERKGGEGSGTHHFPFSITASLKANNLSIGSSNRSCPPSSVHVLSCALNPYPELHVLVLWLSAWLCDTSCGMGNLFLFSVNTHSLTLQ